jgi:hypothetical protein
VVAKWFDTAAFVQPAMGQDGTAGRNIVDRPGLKNVDLGLFRDFKLKETVSLQFRCEMTNAFNLVNLSGPPLLPNSGPNVTLSSGGFGTITTAADMRRVQLGLRLSF